jgi:acetyl/propionyl-CoA carboxylase alpha subunit
VLQYGDQQIEARFEPSDVPTIRAGDAAIVFEAGEAYTFTRPKADAGEGAAGGDGQVLAPMPGRITSVAVSPGDSVAKGQILVTLEAMKMEHGLAAAFDGEVAEVRVTVGDQVTEGTLVVRLEPAA